MIATPPLGGVPVGTGDWMFAVEIALPPPGAPRLGTFVLGTDALTSEVWTDVTAHTSGLFWLRGSDFPGERPATGSGSITLRNHTGQWSPWRNAYHGPGTLIRWSCYSPSTGEWIPQFCGQVKRWGYGTEGRYVSKHVEVELVETVGVLARIDRLASGLVGAGDTGARRMRRLLDDAQWQHGLFDEAMSPITLQSTEMAVNRLTEAHLTADSTDTWFASHRSGRALLVAQNPDDHPEYARGTVARYGSALYGTSTYSGAIDADWTQMRHGSYFYRRFELRPDRSGQVLPDAVGRYVCRLVYDADSAAPEATDEVVINEARYANVGGTQQTAVNEASQGRFGQYVTQRNDLITQHQSDVLTLAQRVVARRSNRSLNIGSIDLHARHGDDGNMPGLFVIDVADPVTFVFPDYYAVKGHVTATEHRIVSLIPGHSLNWRAKLTLETFEPAVAPAIIGGGT